MNMSKKEALKRFIKENDFITIGEARKVGVTPMMLSRLVVKEELYRPERGVYARDLAWLSDPLKKYLPVCTQIPDVVICGISALTYYDLTDEEERKIWIGLPSHKKIRTPRYRVIRYSDKGYSLGITTHSFGKRVVRIYNIEKTVVDAFKYLSEEVALKALKGYIRRKDKNIHRLCEYGKRLRKPLDDVVRALLTEE